MTQKKRIGITSIGSGVGQSVISSCRLSQLPLHTIGLGTNPLAFGAYDCDEHHPLPSIYARDYVDALIERVKHSGIDLIIPCLDDELPLLAGARERLRDFGCDVIVSDAPLLSICRDKERMSLVMGEHSRCFVRSYRLQTIDAALAQRDVSFPLIAKPRDGFASRGIHILLTPADLSRIDESYVIQELAVPHAGDPFRAEFEKKLTRRILPQVAELSIQLVTNRQGALIGRFASYNRLNNGVPIEIIPFDAEHVWAEIEQQLPFYQQLGLRGPLNLQGRLTDQGLRFFEINARFTGITGLRALLGFSEVDACLRCWLGMSENAPIRLMRNPRKIGIRQTGDRAIDSNADLRIADMIDRSLTERRSSQQRILVTGASGHLGRHLVRLLAARPERFAVTAAGRDRLRLHELFSALPQVDLVESSPEHLLDADAAQFDVVVHCAFTRAHGTASEIASSLAYTQRLFDLLARKQIGRLVHLSSRIVYKRGETLVDEESPLDPSTPYAMAKYASELMLHPFRQGNAAARALCVRLSAIGGGDPGPHMGDVLTKIMRRALKENRIDIEGGDQPIDLLHVQDAAEALHALLELPVPQWPGLVNLGGPSVSLMTLARRIAAAVDQIEGRPAPVQVRVNHNVQPLSPPALDVSRLTGCTGWTARRSLDQAIGETLEAVAVPLRLKGAPASV